MKKWNYLIGGILAAVFCLVIAILSLANRPACTSERPMGDGGERSFLASVVEQTDTGVLVEPLESETERKSADRISFRTENLDPLDLQVGDVVNICYTGQIQETYPATIRAVSWSLIPPEE